MSLLAKYYVISPYGVYVDWSYTNLSGFSVLGKEVGISGGAGHDYFSVGSGSIADASDLMGSGGNDVLFLKGNFADYQQTVDANGVYTFTRTAGLPQGQTEIVKFSIGYDDDIVYFADKHVVVGITSIQPNGQSELQDADGNFRLIDVADTLIGGTPEDIGASLSNLGAQASKIYIYSADGLDVPRLPAVGEALDVVGGGGVDTYYVTAGTSVGASDLMGSAGNDKLFLTGKFADYTQTVDENGVYTLTRASGLTQGQKEVVKFASGYDDDVVYFADGFITIGLMSVQPNGRAALQDENGVFRLIEALDLNPSEVTPGLSDIKSIVVVSDPGTDNTYAIGDVIEFDVTMKNEVTVTGAEVFTFKIGTTDVTATLDVAASTLATGVPSVLKFKHTVVTADGVDTNGISYAANAIVGGSIKVASTNADAKLLHVAAADMPTYMVDGVAPSTPVLTLGTGVAGGATSAEAIQASGVVNVNAETGASTVVTFANGINTVTKTVTGAAQAVALSSQDLTKLKDGTITVSAVATDAAGNASASASSSFVLDTAGPDAPLLALGAGVTGGATSAEGIQASGVVTVNAETGASTVVTFTNGTNTVTKTVTGTGAAQAVALSSQDLTKLKDGTITVTAVATDAAGNASASASSSFVLDTAGPDAPVLALGAGVAGGATSAEAIQASGVVTVNAETDAGTVVTFTNGTKTVTKTVTGTGAAQAVALSSQDVTTLTDGTITVTAVATDAAGNASASASSSFVLDTAAPTVPVLALGTGVAGGATSTEATQAGGVVTVNAETGASTVVTFTNGTNTVTKTVTGTGAAQAVALSSQDLTKLKDGTITVTAVATDAAGNASASASSSFVLDTAAPTLHASTSPVTALSTIAGTAGNTVGETITLTVIFDDAIKGLTNGTDSTIFKIAGVGVTANWSGTNSTNTRTLTYTVSEGQSGQVVIDEAALKKAMVDGITDDAGNAFTYDLNTGAIPNIDVTPLPVVDTQSPTVTAVSIVGADSAGLAKTGTLVSGDKVRVTLTTSEDVLVTGSPTYSLGFDSGNKQATFNATLSTARSLVFDYTVVTGDNDTLNGLTSTSSALSLNGSTMRDSAGNTINLTLPNVALNNNQIVVMTNGPSQTVAISNVTDNVGVLQANLTGNNSTDDTTLQLNGTISAALGSGDSIAIYDNGVKLATVSSTTGTGPYTWTYTTSALSSGQHSFTARVENSTTGLTGLTSAAFVENIFATLPTIGGVSDAVGDVIGNVASGGTTDDTRPTLTGTLPTALLTGESIKVFDGALEVAGTMSVNGTGWSFRPTSALSNGSHSLTIKVMAADGTTAQMQSAAYTVTFDTSLTTQTTMITSVTDNVSTNGSVGNTTTSATIANGASTDDTTPTLNGTISAALTGAQVVAVYDTVSGVITKLGNATVSGTTWSYTPSALSAGAHSLTAVVENPASGASSTASAAYVLDVHSGLNTIVTDNVGSNTTKSARYIYLLREGNTSNWLVCGEIQVMSGGVNLALGKTVTAYTGSPSAVVDGNTSSTYVSSTVNAFQWIQVDLGASYSFESIAIYGGVISADSSNVSVYVANTNMSGLSSSQLSSNLIQPIGVTPTTISASVPYVVSTPVSLDDNQATLSGTLSAPLGSGEELAVYDTVNGVTSKLGVATVSGLNWSFKPTTALADGSHNLKAMVQATGDTSGVAGRVVSTPTVFTVDTSTPTQTMTITSVTDNVSTNGSVGNTTTSATIANGASTDDTTPTLNGTISAVLTGAQVVAVYDTVSGVKTKLGNATVSGTTWSYTPSALSAGVHSLTAVVENSTSGASSTASAAYVLDVHSGLTTILSDSVGAVQGVIATGSSTDDNQATLSGTLSAPLGSGEELAVYDTVNGVTSKLGVATVSGLNWSFKPTTALADGSHNLKAMVQATGDTSGVAGRVVSTPTVFTVDTSTPTQTMTITSVTDNVSTNGSVGNTTTSATIANGASTDDTTPTLNGTISAALTGAQVVAVYDTVSGVKTKLGNATVSGTTWSYTPSALSAGVHSLTAVVENSTSGASSTPSSAHAININTALSLTGFSDAAGVSTIPNMTGYSGIASTGGSVTISASSFYSNAYAPWQVADGDYSLNTEFATAGQQANWWLQATYSQAIVLKSVTLSDRLFSNAEYASTWRIQGSNDGITWVTLYTGLSRIGQVAQTYTMSTAESYTSVRFYADTGVGPNPGLSLFQINGVKTPTVSTVPPLLGKIATVLGSGEELAVYDTISGVTSKVNGTVTFSDLNWSFTPSGSLSDGPHTFKAMVQPIGDSSGTLGRVVSGGNSFILDTSIPFQTVTITSVTDNVSTNGSVGNTTTSATIANGASTDDTTPTLNGTISAVLTGAQVVAVYDTVSGVKTKLGNATVSGTTWSYTPSALSAGAHSLTAVVENPASGASSTASAAYVLDVHSGLTTILSDSVGAVQGVIATGSSTDDNQATLSGTLSAPLGSGEELAVYDTVNGVTSKLGVATVSGLNWSFKPTTALADGSHNLKAMVQATGDTSGVAGRVVSTPTVFTVDTSTPTQTMTITSVTDNVSTNGSVGNTTTSATIANGASTDDTTPTLNGTISAVLTGAQVVAVYDTVSGVKTKLGNATVSGTTWSYTPSALSAGAHSLTAVVENPASGASSTASATYVLDVHSGLNTIVTDNVGSNTTKSARYIYLLREGNTSNWLVCGEIQVMSGGVNLALGKTVTAYTGSPSAVVDGNTSSTYVSSTVNAFQWIQVDLGASYSFESIAIYGGGGVSADSSNVSVYVANTNMSGLSSSQLSSNLIQPIGVTPTTISASVPYVVSTPVSLDDNQATLSGTLSAPLGSGEELAVYDTVNGVTSKLGVATVSGLNWSFKPTTALADGSHNLKAMVQATGDTSGVAGRVVSTPTVFTVDTSTPTQTMTITSVTDNVSTNGSVGNTTTSATIANGASTDDTTPTLNGTISAALTGTQVVAVYDTVSGVKTKLGNATVSGTTWSYTPSALSAGVHSLTAVVENPASGASSTASAAYVLDVHSGLTTILSDSVGAVQGVIATGSSTDDNQATLSGTLSAPLGSGEELAVYDTVNGVTSKLGVATVSGLNWSFKPTTALADGSHNLKAMVQATGDTSGVAGRVVSTPTVFTVDTSTPTQTMTITSVTDNVSTNGSVGNTTTSATIANGASTDDTTPTLNGTISAVLTGTQVVAVYDTVSGVKTKLGNATVSGTTWSYTPSALSAGVHSLTAVVENSTSGASSTASAAYVLDVHSGLTTILSDSVGAVQGVIATGSSTDDNQATLSGTLSAPLGSGEELAVYDTVNGVTSKLGVATVSGLNWSFKPTTALADGSHNLKAMVQATGDTSGVAGRVVSTSTVFTVDTSTPTQTMTITSVTDNVSTNGSVGNTTTSATIANGASTDDTTPTLNGTISAALTGAQVVAVYDTVSGVKTKLGNATVSGTTWSYTPSALSAGAHSLTAVVENPASGASSTASATYVLDVHSGLNTIVTDNVGSNTTKSARYIYLLREGNTSNWLVCGEIQVMSGGVNLALGKTVTAYTGSPSAVVDGNTSSTYVSSTVNAFQWIQVDLGASYSFESIAIYGGGGVSADSSNVSVYVANTNMSGLSSSQLSSNLIQPIGVTPTTISASVPYVVSTPVSLDDNQATLSGTLSAPLGSGEELAVYDTVNGVTSKLGVATVSGLNWSFKPTTALADGSHNLKAMVQATGDTSGVAGRVVSTPTVFTVDTSTPTQTMTITSVTDNVSTNGSVGNTTTSATIANGASTDDTTPTLNGTISAVLTGAQVVAVYDTVSGVKTKLGNATVSGTTWSYTPSALSAGAHSLTAVVENPASGASSTASAAYVLDVHSGLTTILSDSVGAVQGVIATGSSTDDNQATLSGTLSAPLGSGEELAVYDTVNGVTSKLGVATVSGLNWSFKPTTALADGSHNLKAMVQATGDTSGVAGRVVSTSTVFTVDTSTPTQTMTITSVTDNVSTNGSVGNTTTSATIANGASTDDTTPTLNGTISAALTGAQVVAVYDTVSGVKTKLGNATVSGTTWSYTPSALSAGVHSLTAVVENSTSGASSTASAAYVLDVHSGLTTILSDSVGAVQGVIATGSSTDDNQATLSGTLSAPLGSGEELAVYDTVNGVTSKLGVATVSGLNWSFKPTTALADGSHNLKAMVQATGDTSGVAGRVVSTPTVFTVDTSTPTQTMTITSVTDNVSTNGSVGNTTTSATIANGASTDDTTPTLNGTISAVLTGAQVVAVYDTVSGVKTKLGNATVSGTTWSYTPSALSAGAHSLTAVVENPASGASSTASATYVLDVHSGLNTIVTDNVGSNTTKSARYIYLLREGNTSNWLVCGEIQVMSGGVNLALGKTVTAYTGSPSAVVDGNTSSTYVSSTVNAFQWIQVDLGASYSFESIAIYGGGGVSADSSNVSVYVANTNMSGLSSSQLSSNLIQPIGVTPTTISASVPYVVSTPVSLDDNQATLSGTLSAPLGSGEELAVYDTVNGVTSKLGVATVSGLNWSFKPTTALADGSHNLKAMVQATGDTSGVAGRVVSTPTVFTVDTSTPTQTMTITSVTDNVSTNGSVGNTTTSATIANGASTDDTTPTLNGTISAVLTGTQVVAVYDTVSGVKTKLGNATVSGTTWSYTPSALSAGVHSLTAVVENPASGASSTASAAYVLDVHSGLTTILSDSVGAVQGVIATGSSTDDNQATLSGTLSAPLGSGEELAVYDTVNGVTSKLGVATVSGLNWSFKPTTALADGSHNLKAMVQATGDTSGVAGRVVSTSTVFTVDTSTPTQTMTITSVTDNVSTNGSVGNTTTSATIANGASTDDTTPTLNGTISAALTGAQVVAVYDTVSGVKTKLGNATVSGTTWSYTPSALSAGAHSLTAVVENPASGASSTASATYVLDVHSGLNTIVTDNVGSNTTKSARYIYLLREGNTSNWLVCGEIQVMSGGVNLALGKTVTAYTGSPSAVVDGNTSSTYVSSTVNAFQWIQVDLGASYSFESIAIYGGVISADSSNVSVYVANTNMSGLSSSQLSSNLIQPIGVTPTTISASVPYVVSTPVSLDDNQATLSGTLSAPLGSGEELAVYDTVNGVTSKLGVATVSGLNWSFKPTTALADGSHNLKAMVQATGDTSGVAGRVVSTPTVFTVDTSTPTQTMTITSVTDNVSTNGSVGNTTTSATIANGASTDDTTPTLNGTISAVLTGAQVVAVYDTVSGVKTKLGNATVSGTTWSYTPSALSAGVHSLTAVVENPANGTSSTVSAAQVVNVHSGLGNLVLTDDVGLSQGLVNSARYITIYNVQTLAEVRILSSGVNVALKKTVAASALTEFVPSNIVDGNTNTFATASWVAPSLTGTPNYDQWFEIDLGEVMPIDSIEITPRSGFSSRTSGAYVALSDTSLIVNTTVSLAAMKMNVQLLTSTDSAVSIPVSLNTDDTRPTLSGTLNVAIGIGEELAVYDTVNGAVSKIGVATVNGLSWTYTPILELSDGLHSLQVMVQTAGATTGNEGRVVSSPEIFRVDTSKPTQTTSITLVTDNSSTNGSVGNTTTAATIANGASTDDKTPTLNGTISATLSGSQVVAVYDTFAGVKTKLGNATVSGNTWTFTPNGLNSGAHSFTAVVENTANGAQAATSGAYAVSVQTIAIDSILDATGSVKGNLIEIAQPITSARYVRVDQITSGILDISELQVWAWVNGKYTNVAQGKTVVSHYSVSSNGAFTNLTDGNTSTDFISANTTSDNWVQIDLGSNYNISEISVVSNSAGTNVISLNSAVVRASKGDMSTYTSSQLAASAGVVSVSLGTAKVGSNQLSWSKSFTSDESMPTLSGTFTTNLGSDELVGIWDGTFRLGSANVNGNSWSYSVGTLSTGTHSLTAKIENSSGQVLAATETISYTLDATAATQGVLINTVTDSYGPITGVLASGSLTDDRNLTLSGVVGVPTLTSNQMVAVYDGTSRLGYATMSGASWSYTISPLALSYGTHSLVAKVENTATGTGATASSAFMVDVQQIALTGIADENGAFTGNVLSSALSYVDAAGTLYTTPSGTSTTDSVSPVLYGTLGHALDPTQVLAVYDGSTRLGNAVVVDKNWTYSSSNLSVGSHQLAFQIESNATPGTSLLKTASFALTVVSQNTDLSPSSSMSLNGSNQILDLTQLSGISWTNVLKSIDLTGISGNTLLLKASDVIQKATVGGVETSGAYANNYQLMINGNATSKVDLTDGSGTSGWTMQSTQKSIGSTVYDVWVNAGNSATLYINHEINSVI